MTKLLIKNGLCIDGKSSEPKKNWIVVIDGEKIVYFGEEASYSLSGDETVIDANGGTILPGLIDTHVHMMLEFSPIAERLATPFSFMYYQAAQYLKTTLHAGVTSVRDALGADLGIKKAIEDGLIPGPRIAIKY